MTPTQPPESAADSPAEPCDHEWKFQDDSFDHEFGTHRVHYYVCEKCDATRDVEASDYHDHDDGGYEP